MSRWSPPEEPPPFLVRLLVSSMISLGALVLAVVAYLSTADEIVGAVTFFVGWVILQLFLRDPLARLFYRPGPPRPPQRRR